MGLSGTEHAEDIRRIDKGESLCEAALEGANLTQERFGYVNIKGRYLGNLWYVVTRGKKGLREATVESTDLTQEVCVRHSV